MITRSARPAILAALALLALPALALPPLTAAAAEPERRQPVIVVSAEGHAAVAPDMAIVTLGVTRSAKTAREALDDNNKAMAEVLAALKADGIAARDLQTSGFSIQPQYVYPENSDGTQKPPVLAGYQVSNMLTVRLREIAKLGGLLDRTITLGVNQGGDIRFTNDDPDQTVTEARKAAVKSAAAKAKTLAEAAGVKLGPVIDITEGWAQPEAQPLARMQMAKEVDAAVPVATGENNYTVNVTMTYAIAP